MSHLLRDDDGMTIYVGCPDVIGGEDGRLLLAGFYQELLGWPTYEAYGDSFLTTKPWSPEISERPKFRLGFNETGWSDVRPPRWPDPDYPQQAHLDILVPDADAYGTRVTGQGATLLQGGDEYGPTPIQLGIRSAFRAGPSLVAATVAAPRPHLVVAMHEPQVSSVGGADGFKPQARREPGLASGSQSRVLHAASVPRP